MDRWAHPEKWVLLDFVVPWDSLDCLAREDLKAGSDFVQCQFLDPKENLGYPGEWDQMDLRARGVS